MDEADLLLLVKLVAVPILVLVASLAARRWGPSGGGFIIGLPLTSGPVLVFLALEQGGGFASEAAVGTLLGVVPLAVYCLTFSRLGFMRGWLATLAFSTMVYFILAIVLSQVYAYELLALGAALFAIGLSLALMPRATERVPDRVLPWWEIPARIVAATTLVILITEGASELGPRWSGLLAPYPIYATVFAVFMPQVRRAQGERTLPQGSRGLRHRRRGLLLRLRQHGDAAGTGLGRLHLACRDHRGPAQLHPPVEEDLGHRKKAHGGTGATWTWGGLGASSRRPWKGVA